MADGTIADQTDGVQIASGDQVLVDRAGADRRVPLATEGSFTPAITFGGASVGITYATQIGRYMRIGSRVFFNLAVVLTNKGSSVGAAVVTGLPFPAEATSGNVQCFAVRALSLSGLSGGVQARVLPGASVVDLGMTGTGSSPNLTNAEFLNATTINLSGHYQV